MRSAEGSGADVFVSYAREELFFVQRLGSLLESAGLRAWVDVEGVYGGEEFWPEICKAIDAAAVVLFVISRDSVTSPFCRRELERAIAGQKRIVPVCREMAEVGLLPTEVGSRQWIFFRDEDDATVAGDALLRAIRADWVWLRQHARLLVRAVEWEARGHDRSLTLRGRELRESEEWLELKPDGEMRPSTLQEAFIRASRDAKRHRILRMVAVAVSALVIIGIVGWFAITREIESLNNLSLDDLSKGYVDERVARLVRAENLCSLVPISGDRCYDVTINLGLAYLDKNEYADALVRFTRIIDVDATPGKDDPIAQGFRADAFQNRAYAHIMRAETRTDQMQRAGDYALAEDDLNAATRIYDRLPGGAAAQPFEVTRARIHIGRGDYQQALTELERAARVRDNPDIDLLLSVTYRCLGDGRKSVESFQRYVLRLPGRSRDPNWLRNQAYYEGIAQRCSRQPQ